MAKKLISIVIPVFNEEKNIGIIAQAITQVFQQLGSEYDHELLFVDDGSSDNSPKVLENLQTQDKHIRYIQFSRNFGKELALSAGLKHAKGDAIISMDADLQHPTEFIPEFIQSWENGAEIVIGLRQKYKSGNAIRRFLSYVFYKMQNSMSDVKINPDETDYRLLDRQVVEEFNRFTERTRITRGLIDWLGFTKGYVYFPVSERIHHKSSFSFFKLFTLAISAFIAHSLLPLKIAGYLGLFTTFTSAFLGVMVVIERFILHDFLHWNVSGTALLALLTIFMSGVTLSCLGLISLYIANIHNEVANRPLYIIKKQK